MQEVADHLGIHPVEVYSVVTFYAFLGESVPGQVRDPAVPDDLLRHGGQGAASRASSRTTSGSASARPRTDGKFTLEWANCLGMCDQGPALLVNDHVFTR